MWWQTCIFARSQKRWRARWSGSKRTHRWGTKKPHRNKGRITTCNPPKAPRNAGVWRVPGTDFGEEILLKDDFYHSSWIVYLWGPSFWRSRCIRFIRRISSLGWRKSPLKSWRFWKIARRMLMLMKRNIRSWRYKRIRLHQDHQNCT